VAGDPGRLEQVILNLLTNAIAYAPGTDRIEVKVRRYRNQAEVTVRDFGPGIERDKLESIFDRFVQGEPGVRPGTSGLGLGLYISREIVRSHGGSIAADSEPGKGATFTMRLPLIADPPKKQISKSAGEKI
jgi:two-component system, chemotaxis family, CheB/CheR fusion protein